MARKRSQPKKTRLDLFLEREERKADKLAILHHHGLVDKNRVTGTGSPLVMSAGRPIFESAETLELYEEVVFAVDAYRQDMSDDEREDPLVYARIKRRNARLMIKRSSRVMAGDRIGFDALFPSEVDDLEAESAAQSEAAQVIRPKALAPATKKNGSHPQLKRGIKRAAAADPTDETSTNSTSKKTRFHGLTC